MNEDFELVRRAGEESWLGRAWVRVTGTITRAWASSAVGAWVRRSTSEFGAMDAASRIRWTALAIMVAALGHLALRSMVSSTVAPALPALFIAGVAVFAAIVAWQSTAFERAWRER